jgi:uncharacterized protein
MDLSQTKHGQFSWNELLTTDPAAAIDFYKQLFGWTTQDFQMPDFTYSVVKLKDAEQGQGGIMAIPSHAAGMPPAWFPYVTVDNVDNTAKQATQLGGNVLVEPKDIPEVGRFAVIQDPQGAAISVITYKK